MIYYEIYLEKQFYDRYKSLVGVCDAMRELIHRGIKHIEIQIKDKPAEDMG